MGWIADRFSTPAAYWVPLICFLFVLYYGISGYKIREAEDTVEHPAEG
jgi:fucose permease